MIKFDLRKLITCGLDLEDNIDPFINQPSVETEEVVAAVVGSMEILVLLL